MRAAEVLGAAEAAGVEVGVDGDGLTLEASGQPSAELLAKLKAHKAEIIELLRAVAIEEQNGARVDAEFDRQLERLKADNAKIYANPTPWQSK